MKINISVVIPVYNEQRNLRRLYKELKKTLNKVTRNHEIIFVNDGSTDDSLKMIRRLRIKDKKVKYLSFSRNFGHMPAVNAGLASVSGLRIVIMDADLQDPPSVIEKMYNKSLEGFEIVYAVKKNRKEGFIKKASFSLFYKILDKVSYYKMPANAGTYSLISQKVAKLISNLNETNKYFSGLRAWVGYSQTSVEYERAARHSGNSKPFGKLLKLALDGLVSFSYLPLRLASYFGFISASFAFIFILVVVVLRIFFGVGIIGWASTMSTILLVGGIQLITLGIVGEYLARIYDEVKKRPEYVIDEKVGLGK